MHHKSVLDNGITVVTESLPSQTVSAGIWIDVGSRDEKLNESGCAHFVEHMLFKGTPSHGAIDIAREFDRLGGMSNAFTAKETTCLYGTVLASQFPQLLHLLTDIFQNSIFDPTETEREKNVILQEIGMVEDTPEDLVHDLFAEVLWEGHTLSNSVLGKPKTIIDLNSQRLRDFVEKHYLPERIIFAVAGSIEHHEVLGLLGKAFSAGRYSVNSTNSGIKINAERTPPEILPDKVKLYPKKLEQAHVLLGCCCPPVNSPKRYELALLNVILGGNMSSRLFQEVREKRGLAYSIYSFIDSRRDSGSMGIYAGVDSQSANEVESLVREVINNLCSGDIEKDELERAKDYARAGLFLGSENMEFRMTRLAQNELNYGKFFTVEQVDEAMSAISVDKVIQIARETLHNQPLSGVVLGIVDDCSFTHETVEDYRDDL